MVGIRAHPLRRKGRELNYKMSCTVLPSSLGDDHLRAQLIELVPQILGLQVAVHMAQLLATAAFLQAGVPGDGGRGRGRRAPSAARPARLGGRGHVRRGLPPFLGPRHRDGRGGRAAGYGGGGGGGELICNKKINQI